MVPQNAAFAAYWIWPWPALLEAFDADRKVVDSARLESVTGRKAPGEPVPLTVSGKRIAYIEFFRAAGRRIPGCG